jgi:hypothetical protein
MAEYCSQADIEGAVGGASALNWVADPLNTSPALAATTTLITSCRVAATALIDAYATGTPGSTGTAGAMWSTTPDVAKHAAIAISLYFIYSRVRREEIPADVLEQYKLYADPDKGLLAKLAKGEVAWVASETPPAQNVGTVWAFTEESTAREANPRRTRRASRDLL